MTAPRKHTPLHQTVRQAVRREVLHRMDEGGVLVDGNWFDMPTAARRRRNNMFKTAWIMLERLLLIAAVGLLGLALLALANLLI